MLCIQALFTLWNVLIETPAVCRSVSDALLSCILYFLKLVSIRTPDYTFNRESYMRLKLVASRQYSPVIPAKGQR